MNKCASDLGFLLFSHSHTFFFFFEAICIMRE